MLNNRQNTIEDTVKIKDIIVTPNLYRLNEKRSIYPAGEFDSKARLETEAKLIDRLYRYISHLIKIASTIHQIENCQIRSTQLKSDKTNNITRLVTSEFFFFTQRPLRLEQFKILQTKIVNFCSKQPPNLHLILASFVVKTLDDILMNVVAYIECGLEPTIRFIVKNRISTIDPHYVRKKRSNETKTKIFRYLSNKTRANEIPYPIIINGQRHGFTFNNLFACKSMGGISFYTLLEICIDHKHKIAIQNLREQLKMLLAGSKNNIWLFSHVVVANSTDLDPNNFLGDGTHADPGHTPSDTSLPIDLGFGKPATLYRCKPKDVDDLMRSAATIELLDVVYMLLKLGFDPNAPDSNGETFMVWVKKKNLDIISMLMEHAQSMPTDEWLATLTNVSQTSLVNSEVLKLLLADDLLCGVAAKSKGAFAKILLEQHADKLSYNNVASALNILKENNIPFDLFKFLSLIKKEDIESIKLGISFAFTLAKDATETQAILKNLRNTQGIPVSFEEITAIAKDRLSTNEFINAISANITIAAFKERYTHIYENEFFLFRNPFSDMKTKLEDNSTNMYDVKNHAKDNPNSRTVKVLLDLSTSVQRFQQV